MKVNVIGAGFTGLAMAYTLHHAGFSVEVYERSAREGGLIQTFDLELGKVETGANALLNSARVEALFEELGLPLLRANKESRRRFIYRNGPTRWPLSLGTSLRVLGFFLRFIFLRKSVAPLENETIREWGARVFGTEGTDYLLLPALQGIYAGKGDRLSAALILGHIFNPRKSGRRPSFRGSVSAFTGMGELLSSMRDYLESRGVRFHFCVGIPTRSDAEVTYFTGSAADAAEVLENRDPELSALLQRIEMLPLVTITAFFSPDERVRKGFGVLFPPKEGFNSLGVLYNHVIFENRTRLPLDLSETWILGGALHPELVRLTDAQLIRKILADRRRLNGFPEDVMPFSYSVQKWPKAIPYYTVELHEILKTELNRRSNEGDFRLMGNYLGVLGLTKILDRCATTVEALVMEKKKV